MHGAFDRAVFLADMDPETLAEQSANNFQKVVAECHAIVTTIQISKFEKEDTLQNARSLFKQQMSRIRTAHEAEKAHLRSVAWQEITRTRDRDLWSSCESWLKKTISAQNIRARQALVPLKVSLNALAPVNRLSPELLCAVFHWVIVSGQSHFQHYATSYSSSDNPWKRFPNVCKYWRTAAIDYASIWGYIGCSSAAWASVMLERSKMASLDVRTSLEYHEERVRLLQSIICGNRDRIRSLHVKATHKIIYDILKRLPPMSNLERLHLNVESQYSMPDSAIQLSEYLTRESSSLRDFSYKAAHRIDLPPEVFRHLVRLSIETNTFRTGMGHHPLRLLECLSGAPHLQELRLKDAFVNSDEASSTRLPVPVDLPLLQELSIHDDYPRCVQILECIDFPANGSLTVVADNISTEVDLLDYLSLIAAKKGRALPELNELFHRCCLSISDNGCDLRGWHKSELSVVRPSADLHLGFSWYGCSPDHKPNHHWILKLLLLKTETLLLEREYSLEVGKFQAAFEGSLNVRNIDIKGSEFTFLGRVPRLKTSEAKMTSTSLDEQNLSPEDTPLTDSDPDSNMLKVATSTQAVVFPKLEQLVIKDVGYWSPSALEDLRSSLIYRKERNAPIRAVKVVRCTQVPRNIVDRLSGLTDFYWDGLGEARRVSDEGGEECYDDDDDRE